MQKKIIEAYNLGLNSGVDSEQDNPYEELTEEFEAWEAGREDKYRLWANNTR